MGKRGRRQRDEGMGLVPGQTSYDDEPVVLTKDAFGRAAMLPASARNLSGDLAELLGVLGDVTHEIRTLEEEQAAAAGAARAHGLSWALIGWATGLTGEGARLKWKDAAALHAADVERYPDAPR